MSLPLSSKLPSQSPSRLGSRLSGLSRGQVLAFAALTMALLEITRRVLLALAWFLALTPGEFNLGGGIGEGGGGIGGGGVVRVKAQSGGVAGGEYLLGLGIGDVTG